MEKKRVIEALVIVVAILTMIVIYVNLILSVKDDAGVRYRTYEPFGYETSHDEYVDNKPKGRYTKSGVRILTKNEQ